MKIVFLTAWVGSRPSAWPWFGLPVFWLYNYVITLDVAAHVLWEESYALQVC